MSDIIQTQNRNTHRPHHIYSGHTYFVTGRCYEGKKYFFGEERKRIWEKVFQESIERFEIQIYAWVLLDNHYHILFSLPQSIDNTSDSPRTDFALAQSITPLFSNERNDEMSATNFVTQHKTQVLTEFIRKLHKDTSRILNKHDQHKGRTVWYQYFDYCIRNIPDFWKHFNYILKNPLKHGLVHSLEESLLYPHSSNPTWLRRFGAESIHEGFCKYPVKEVIA